MQWLYINRKSDTLGDFVDPKLVGFYHKHQGVSYSNGELCLEECVTQEI